MMKKCENGHFYDDTKDKECPYCKDKMSTFEPVVVRSNREREDIVCERCGKKYDEGLARPLFCWECGGDIKYIRKRPEIELSTDYEGRCGNCHKYIGEDAYCRYCGTKKGEGKFEPYDNFIPCVYGSPGTYIHECQKCGTVFQSSGMSVPSPRYCYKCGSDAISENIWDEKSLKCDILLGSQSVHATQGHGSADTKFEYDTYTVKYETWCSINGKSNTNTEEIKVPESIKTIDELIKFLRKEKPMWCLNLYVNDFDVKIPPKINFDIDSDNDLRTTIPPLNFVTVDPIYKNTDNIKGKMRTPESGWITDDNEKTIDPIEYNKGTYAQMSDVYGKIKAKKQDYRLYDVLVALIVAIYVLCIVLVLLNN